MDAKDTSPVSKRKATLRLKSFSMSLRKSITLPSKRKAKFSLVNGFLRLTSKVAVGWAGLTLIFRISKSSKRWCLSRLNKKFNLQLMKTFYQLSKMSLRVTTKVTKKFTQVTYCWQIFIKKLKLRNRILDKSSPTSPQLTSSKKLNLNTKTPSLKRLSVSDHMFKIKAK